jgi:hypothetical protein
MSGSEFLSKGNGMRLGDKPTMQSTREIGMRDRPEVGSMESEAARMRAVTTALDQWRDLTETTNPAKR